MAPWFIPTDAVQPLPVWETRGGEYIRPTQAQTIDGGYGIHYSTSTTTLGCIRVAAKIDQVDLVKLIQKAQARGEPCTLEVIP